MSKVKVTKKRKSKKPTMTKFKIGDKVRVRHGITDVEYPDMPMGGWAGTIAEIHDDGMYTVRWSRETLAAIHPVFKKRCERDGMALEEYWLGQIGNWSRTIAIGFGTTDRRSWA